VCVLSMALIPVQRYRGHSSGLQSSSLPAAVLKRSVSSCLTRPSNRRPTTANSGPPLRTEQQDDLASRGSPDPHVGHEDPRWSEALQEPLVKAGVGGDDGQVPPPELTVDGRHNHCVGRMASLPLPNWFWSKAGFVIGVELTSKHK